MPRALHKKMQSLTFFGLFRCVDWSSVGLTASREKWRLSRKEWRMTRDVVVVIPATSLTLPLLGRYLLFSMVSFSLPGDTAEHFSRSGHPRIRISAENIGAEYWNRF